MSPFNRLQGVIVATFNYTGLRRDELIHARRGQLDLERRRLRVVDKGSKAPVISIPQVLTDALGSYPTEIRPTLRPSPYLFANPHSQRNGGNMGKFGEKAIARITEQLGEAASVPGRHHPHKWRHTYATRLLRNGVDIHIVQRLLGHSNITTTVGYLHLLDEDLASAVDDAFA